MAGEIWTLDDIPDLTGRVAVVTGGTGPLGAAVAEALARAGARVILGVEDLEAGAAAVAGIEARHPAARVEAQRLDLAALRSVKRFAQGTRTRLTRLDICVAAAQAQGGTGARTADGFEPAFGINHLAHFALVGHLMPLLQATPGARVVALASAAHRAARLDPAALPAAARGEGAGGSFAASQLAALAWALVLASRCGAAGPVVTVADPGRGGDGRRGPAQWIAQRLGLGAADPQPVLRAACDPTARPGDYFVAGGRFGRWASAPPRRARPSRAARNSALAEALWAASETLTGVSY